MSATGFAKFSCCSCCSCWGPYNWAADRRPYLHCYRSELSETVKIGWLGHLYKLSTVLETFVPSNFCPCSICPSLNLMEYLSRYQSNFTQTLKKGSWEPKICLTQILLIQFFWTQDLLDLMFLIFILIFFKPKIFGPKSFWT